MWTHHRRSEDHVAGQPWGRVETAAAQHPVGDVDRRQPGTPKRPVIRQRRCRIQQRRNCDPLIQLVHGIDQPSTHGRIGRSAAHVVNAASEHPGSSIPVAGVHCHLRPLRRGAPIPRMIRRSHNILAREDRHVTSRSHHSPARSRNMRRHSRLQIRRNRHLIKANLNTIHSHNSSRLNTSKISREIRNNLQLTQLPHRKRLGPIKTSIS